MLKFRFLSKHSVIQSPAPSPTWVTGPLDTNQVRVPMSNLVIPGI